MANEKLIVYYSRSGVSETLAKALQNKLGCPMDKLEYAEKDRVSFGTALLEAFRKSTAAVKGAVHNPGDYDTVIFITPIWAQSLATPIRSYMSEHKEAVKSYILLATCGKSGLPETIKDAAAVLGKEPSAAEYYRSSHVAKGVYNLEQFL
ncbi:MAG: hypothetical protein LBG73_04445 [Spirochaetaceae bacterium]|jgi:hypothetical protein|nr:hypothetical protein [Spirochaetaceae bacterium]